MSKRVVVTGASGFLGRHLVGAARTRGLEVLPIQRQASQDGLAFDCPNLEARLSEFSPDAVVHLAAAYGAEARGVGLNANILLPLRLLNWAATQADVRFIVTGSFWQFGNQQHNSPLDYYSASKQALAVYLDYFRNREKLEVYQLVLSSTYGPQDPRGKLVDYLIQQAFTGMPANLGDPGKRFSLTDVRDVVSAIIGLLEAQTQLPDLTYKVRQEHLYGFDELSALFSALGYPIQMNFSAQTSGIEISQPADSPIQTLPGWHPQYRLEDYVRQRFADLTGSACSGKG